MINAQTRSLWMLGHPVTQTVSPGLFNRAFAQAQENLAMLAIDVPPAQLGSAMQVLRHADNVLGCLLTIPHKLPAVQYMDVLTERSQALGLVNIVRKTSRGLEGDALDGQGLVGALALHGYSLQNLAVLIIGCGGAGASCAWDALESGAGCIGLFDSDTARQQAVADMLRQRFGELRVQVLARPAGDWSCVLNASPLGMRIDDELPMPLTDLPPGAVLVDATTPAQPSRWLLLAQQRGHPVIHGADFTRGQVLAMARFFGLSDAVQVGLQAAR
jgi:shikimate dehydrogenase